MKPLLLDLFCGAGGAAMGYYRAGFDVVGVDVVDQPRFPFTFYRADALEFLAGLDPDLDFDAVHASPPCQDHSCAARGRWGRDYGTGHLLGGVLDALVCQPRPFVVENICSRAVREQMRCFGLEVSMLCGSMFGLTAMHEGMTFQMRRHRLFGTTFSVGAPGPCRHEGPELDVTGHSPQGKQYAQLKAMGIKAYGVAVRRAGMGMDWANCDELSQAIPPAFTEHIGLHLLAHAEGR